MLPPPPGPSVAARPAAAVSQDVGDAAGAQQWPNPVARTPALHRGSLRGLPSWAEANGCQKVGGLSGRHPVGRTARAGCLRTPACGLRPQTSGPRKAEKTECVTHVLALMCYPCPGLIPTPALSSLGEEREKNARGGYGLASRRDASGAIAVSVSWHGLAWQRKKRRRAAALQDAGARFEGCRQREAFWSAPALWSFFPMNHPYAKLNVN